MEKTETIRMNDGNTIPSIGFGTWQIPEGEAAYAAVRDALDCGYTHIDTAKVYGNERSVGRAVRSSGIDRGALFITSKLPAAVKGYDETYRAFGETMEDLGLEYLDLYLIHAPWKARRDEPYDAAANAASWRAMEELRAAGKIRSIGISNFEPEQTAKLMEGCTVRPAVNQIAFFIGHRQAENDAYCKKEGILIEAYSPLAIGKIFRCALVGEMAAKYGVTPAQLCIRYCLQKGTVALPKSVHRARILENIDHDFTIGAEDLLRLDAVEEDFRQA